MLCKVLKIKCSLRVNNTTNNSNHTNQCRTTNHCSPKRPHDYKRRVTCARRNEKTLFTIQIIVRGITAQSKRNQPHPNTDTKHAIAPRHSFDRFVRWWWLSLSGFRGRITLKPCRRVCLHRKIRRRVVAHEFVHSFMVVFLLGHRQKCPDYGEALQTGEP